MRRAQWLTTAFLAASLLVGICGLGLALMGATALVGAGNTPGIKYDQQLIEAAGNQAYEREYVRLMLLDTPTDEAVRLADKKGTQAEVYERSRQESSQKVANLTASGFAAGGGMMLLASSAGVLVVSLLLWLCSRINAYIDSRIP